MQREFWDTRSNEWLDGYIFGINTPDVLVLEFYAKEDELYCLERQEGVWVMIDTKTALEWGL